MRHDRTGRPSVPLDMARAVRHLRRADPVMADLTRRHAPHEARARSSRFWALADAIVSQQVSWQAAETVARRLRVLYGREPTPAQVLATPLARLRAVGLSGRKAAYLLSLAAAAHGRQVDLARLHRHDDEDVVAQLTQVPGIGRWTAEMFLMFVLRRPDVLPLDDYGIRKAMRTHYRLRTLPTARRMEEIARPWRPYRTAACLYLWGSLRATSRA